MSDTDTDNELSTEQVATEQQVGPGLLPRELSENSINDWKDSAAECVRSNIVVKQQFLVSDACLDMGGSIQRHVTKFINISNVARITQFWDEHGGRETVRNTFRRKRQAAQNSMKIAFKGKYKQRRFEKLDN